MYMLNIQAIPALQDNYIWLIHCVDTAKAIIVDPSEAAPVIKTLRDNQLTPVAILITHYHYDHVDGIAELVQQYQIPVYGPDNAFIPHITNTVSVGSNLTIHPSFPAFSILDIPGHTAIHIGYLLQDMLFCGDTLFAAGCGKLLGGTAKQLFSSIQQLSLLPSETKLFCGHEYTQANLSFALAIEPNNPVIKQRIEETTKMQLANKPSLPTTLKLELESNPYLRCDHPDVIQAAQQFAGCELTTPLAVFTALRTWKDRFLIPYYQHKKTRIG